MTTDTITMPARVSGFAAFVRDDDGRELLPATSAEWPDWVAASRTRNWALRDPLLDWLHLHGAVYGYVPDPPGDPRCDFSAFVFEKGRAFEAGVLRHIEALARVYAVPGDGPAHSMSLAACDDTFAAMRRGEEVIYQGVLRNPANQTYGAPDFLIRSDVLHRLFPDALTGEEARIPAPALGGGPWHYRVVDVKFTNLQLDARWEAGNDHLPYKVQVWLYNEALGRIQGYLPGHAYLLGRGWKKGTNEAGSDSCMDRLAPVAHCAVPGGRARPLREVADEAVAWIRRLRREGHAWDPVAGIGPEMLPNLANDSNQPWTGAVRDIARRTEDVTLAWMVGEVGREKLRALGYRRWTEGWTAAQAGVNNGRGGSLDSILAVNREPLAPAVSPERVTTEREAWGTPRGVEFYVDFETVSNLDDDFSRLPLQNGQPRIFMIGCGHYEDGEWVFECFTARDLTLPFEAEIVEAWLEHMRAVQQRLAPDVERPLVFHWSQAEPVNLSSLLQSARTRHPDREASWIEPEWYDFLTRVMRVEPVIVKGPMGFGLKNVAKSLKCHGLIETEWADGVTDGLGAMVAAWRCHAEARAGGGSMCDIPLMRDVQAYNEVDCRVMAEAIAYLRANH
ncbi:MAG: hypothetical protein U0547_06215 [Dehalococcoidia bacterium]